MATKKGMEKKEGKDTEAGAAPAPDLQKEQVDIGSLLIEVATLRALVSQQRDEINWLRTIVGKKKSR